MLLHKIIAELKEVDTHNLFCTDQNEDFIKVINSIADLNSSHDIYKKLSSFFDTCIHNSDKNSLIYNEAYKLQNVVDKFFKKQQSSHQSNISSNIMFDEEFSRMNGFIEKKAEEIEETNIEINPGNQEFISVKDRSGGLNETSFGNEYVNEETETSFFYTEEECVSGKKIDFNKEIFEIYMKSLKTFAREVDHEALHRHCYYLENDGQWNRPEDQDNLTHKHSE